MDWEEIGKAIVSHDATEESLALLFLKKVAEVESESDLMRLINMFLSRPYEFNSNTIARVCENIKKYFTFEIHKTPRGGSPCAVSPFTGFQGRQRDVKV